MQVKAYSRFTIPGTEIEIKYHHPSNTFKYHKSLAQWKKIPKESILNYDNDLDLAVIKEILNSPSTISITWSIEDIEARAKDNYDLTDIPEYTLKGMLSNIKNSHDCTQGITWETLDSEIEDYINSEDN